MIRPIFDAHLDLAWSAVGFNRDLMLEVADIRRLEEGMSDEPRADEIPSAFQN